MRISDWSSDVCSSDLLGAGDVVAGRDNHVVGARLVPEIAVLVADIGVAGEVPAVLHIGGLAFRIVEIATAGGAAHRQPADRAGRHRIAALVDHARSEEHTSALQSLMRHSYAVICLKKKKLLSTNKIDSV